MDLQDLASYDDIYDNMIQHELIQIADNLNDENRAVELPELINAMIEIDEDRRKKQYGLNQRRNLKPSTIKLDETGRIDPRDYDGVPILSRENTHKFKVDHKIHIPFDSNIVKNKTGYFVGKKPNFQSENKDYIDRLNTLNTMLNFYKNIKDVCVSAVGEGEGFVLLSCPVGIKDVKMTVQKSYHCIVLSDADVPRYGLIYYKEKNNSEYTCYWYDETYQTKLNGNSGGLSVIGEPLIHLFEGVPLIEFANNTNRMSDVEITLSAQDKFDLALSDLSSEIGQTRLAYLLLNGFGMFSDNENDNKELLDMFKKAGILLGDGEKVDAKFIEKNLNPEAVKFLMDSLRELIYTMSNSYDPGAMANMGGNITAFQIKQMLYPLEQVTIDTEIEFKKSLTYMYNLIGQFYTQYGKELSFDFDDVTINFTRNFPANPVQDIKDMREAGQQFAQETLYNLSPLEFDYEANKKALEKEDGLIEGGLINE